ncbi:hypothetical protein F5X99DRAFT_210450 [Biscogniauxia marginata]|nr:hypothetical protein F5X99DRAFT_210450 [Biscogniauxia marginata]
MMTTPIKPGSRVESSHASAQHNIARVRVTNTGVRTQSTLTHRPTARHTNALFSRHGIHTPIPNSQAHGSHHTLHRAAKRYHRMQHVHSRLGILHQDAMRDMHVSARATHTHAYISRTFGLTRGKGEYPKKVRSPLDHVGWHMQNSVTGLSQQILCLTRVAHSCNASVKRASDTGVHLASTYPSIHRHSFYSLNLYPTSVETAGFIAACLLPPRGTVRTRYLPNL